MREKDCKIIQNLLPNYIDNLTDEELNIYIEEHLDKCENCHQALEDMKKEIEINNQNRETREIKEIQYMKKFKNKIKMLKSIILFIFLLILITFVIITGRKMIIISDLVNRTKKYETSTNYHIIMRSYSDKSYSKEETFILGDKIKVIGTYVTDEGIETCIDIRK